MNQHPDYTDSPAVLELKDILATAKLNEYERIGLQLCIDMQIEEEKEAQRLVAKYIGCCEESKTLADMKLFLATAELTETEKKSMELLIAGQKECDESMKEMAQSMVDAAASNAIITKLQIELYLISKDLAEHDLDSMLADITAFKPRTKGFIRSQTGGETPKELVELQIAEAIPPGTQAHQHFMDEATAEANPTNLIFDKVREMRKKLSADSNQVE